jgi:hypothetical protein
MPLDFVQLARASFHFPEYVSALSSSLKMGANIVENFTKCAY